MHAIGHQGHQGRCWTVFIKEGLWVTSNISLKERAVFQSISATTNKTKATAWFHVRHRKEYLLVPWPALAVLKTEPSQPSVEAPGQDGARVGTSASHVTPAAFQLGGPQSKFLRLTGLPLIICTRRALSKWFLGMLQLRTLCDSSKG